MLERSIERVIVGYIGLAQSKPTALALAAAIDLYLLDNHGAHRRPPE
jgi:hypothetical protein